MWSQFHVMFLASADPLAAVTQPCVVQKCAWWCDNIHDEHDVALCHVQDFMTLPAEVRSGSTCANVSTGRTHPVFRFGYVGAQGQCIIHVGERHTCRARMASNLDSVMPGRAMTRSLWAAAGALTTATPSANPSAPVSYSSGMSSTTRHSPATFTYTTRINKARQVQDGGGNTRNQI